MQPVAPGEPGGADLGRDVIGQRVTLRILAGGPGPSGGPAQRDLVGILEDVDPTGFLVRRRDGSTQRVDRKLVTLAKVIPELTRRIRRAADVGVAELERIAASGWRPIEQALLGDWILRASSGFTGRANSVLPLGDPGVDLDSALTRIGRWYAQRSLPPQFQLPTPYAAELDAQLSARGWTAFNPTQVLVADVEQLLIQLRDVRLEVEVRMSDVPDSQWLTTYNYRGRPLPTIAADVLVNTDNPLFASATVRSDAGLRTVAVARAAVSGSWVGFTALEVEPSVRRTGVARQLMRVLTTDAQRLGARHAYLQVADENAAALAFYDRLGFVHHHRYHYVRDRGL